MKTVHTRKQLLAFFMPGFLAGIIYVNLIAKKYMAEPGIFSGYFLEEFKNTKIVAEEYLWYLLRFRALPLLVLAGLSFTKARKPAAMLFLLWTGFSGGLLISAAVLSMGIKGSIFCLAGLFPQFILYIPAFLILLWYCIAAPADQWNRQKTIFIFLAMSLGIILEIYVNPVVIRLFLSTL